MVYYSFKINNKEYIFRESENGFEISTEIGWLPQDRFIDYLVVNEKQNSLIDLAKIGLDRLLNI